MKENTLPATQAAEIDYWFTYRRLIEQLTKITGELMDKLKTDNFITEYHEAYSPKYDVHAKLFRLLYDCTMPFGVNYTVRLRLRFSLETYGNRVKIEDSNSRYLSILSGRDVILESIERVLLKTFQGWNKGCSSEKTFKRILEELVKKIPHRITHAFQTSQHDDKDNGTDFVVRMITKPYYETKEVAFNLKSSTQFLGEHKHCYPSISTFIFQETDLSDITKLERRILRFLVAARSQVVHF